MSKTFAELHPDIARMNAYETNVRSYKNLDIKGRIIEAWELDEAGVWHDVTLREQLIQQAELELVKAKRELKKITGGKDDEQDC
jgi:hypothetical protein